ncbi:MAG: hypothetical protein AVDCRST_MAG41-1563 [uncultured Corynebacteriales bacterium]|uniref:Arsenate reductase n=1 Tax=uncultured Mycobacteriales bacterium TaxID=581187 RepID=A0A6J4I606_9ACTN|nr:MAG: hypothetical protein AVDCRST_MAG41-1563 [uncultured Corynebacteriales bacterium]
MTGPEPSPPDAWVPSACTLPTAERPLRVAEFDRLFGTALRDVRRVADTTLVLELAPAPGRAAEVRDLARRETACCSFFAFTVEDGDPLRVRVEVPAERAGVLAALAERATRLSAAP